ncbi:MarR family transcriptional regulator [Colwellia sp. UCD-KL20]|uniref:MarR family winged helix-turn-helix transcriptional regulator n=1 Tax=Colwellia sp. UCD-KL20 TaxID=1917165 RepID=UPI000970B9BC|nr:MarR family transcriptional regulator [Colwellia sp. UCD-KL20]
MSNEYISDVVFDIIHSYRIAMRSALNASDLGLNYMHVRCLTFINSNEVCTANDIVSYFARDKAQIARLIKEMIDKQWLTKTINLEDKRSQFLSLTEEGKRLVAFILKTQANVHKQMQKDISSQALENFQQTAEAMATNLKMFK